MSNNIKISLENICPYVRSAGVDHGMNWQGRMRKIYDYELMYYVSGKGEYIVDDKKHPVNPGCLILIKPNIPHTIIMQNDFKYMWVHFDFMYREDVKILCEYLTKNPACSYSNEKSELFQDSLSHSEWIREQPDFDDNFLFPDYILLHEYEAVESLFKKLLFEYYNKKVAYQIICKALLLNIFAEVMQQIFKYNDIELGYSHYRTFYKLITFIEKNYYKRITLSDLENIVDLTGDYISKIFKEKTSYSAIEYINYYRIKKAKELLVHEDLKVTDVANMVGFDDIHYFSKIFKKYEGASPNNYCKANNLK